MRARSPTTQPSPSVTPADTTAPSNAVAARGRAAAAPRAGRCERGGRRLLADHGVVADPDALADHGPRVGATAVAATSLTQSCRPKKRSLQLLEHAHDREPVLGDAHRVALAGHEVEAPASRAAAARRGDLRARDVAGARLPLALRLEPAARAPSRRSASALEPPCRQRPAIASVPTTVSIRIVCGRARRGAGARSAGRKAEVAEDDVLDAGRGERCRAGEPPLGPSSRQVPDDGEVVRAEAPEGVLVVAHLAEVLAVRVEVERTSPSSPARSGP